MKKNKGKIAILTLSVVMIIFSITYAFINQTLTGNKRQVITSGNLELILDEDENNLQITNALPMYDEVGMIQSPFTFRVVNKGSIPVNYVLKLEEITVDGGLLRSDVKYGLTKDNEQKNDLVSNIVDNTIDEGVIQGNQTIEYSLRLWVKEDVTDISTIQNKSMKFRLNVIMRQITNPVYTEAILNGTDPVLSEDLIPVMIEDDGVVRKANLYSKWYSYKDSVWANAVILEDKTIEYKENQIIPEENIESYFVWIPKYSYQLWDLGNYNSLTSIDNSKAHIIPVKFGLGNTSDSKTGECTTPGTSGGSGNCKIGDYMTHPAFLAFDSTGFWVGKFESGYKDAATKSEAEVNSYDSTKLQIKPNVYSWRNITVGNAFKVSYDYNRNLESHLIKNTEWGAVAYLQHSTYGSHESVRTNNNNSYLVGYAAVEEPTLGYNGGISIPGNINGTTEDVTQPYNTTTGYLASTASNISGVYDMSGGSNEYVMGYNMNATAVGGESGITNLYVDFFTNSKWDKYYDRYSNGTTSTTSYNKRILGDATGEVGPFGKSIDPDKNSRRRTSWYNDLAFMLNSQGSWFHRGGHCDDGIGGGIFNFRASTGNVNSSGTVSFRVALTPSK